MAGKRHSAGQWSGRLRLCLAVCAAVALALSIASLREGLAAGPFEDVADRLSAGQRYRPEAIERALPYIEGAEQREGCSRIFRDLAMIRVDARQIAAAAGDQAKADLHLGHAIEDLEKDLACAPAQAFSWFLLFSLRSSRDHRVSPHLPLLAMSYQLGPNEGSFTPLRVRAALPLLRAFGPNMRSYVENDFLAIARDQVAVAADIFAEAPPASRAELTPLLKKTPLEQRTKIVARLDGLNVPVPPELEPPRR